MVQAMGKFIESSQTDDNCLIQCNFQQVVSVQTHEYEVIKCCCELRSSGSRCRYFIIGLIVIDFTVINHINLSLDTRSKLKVKEF